MGAGFDCLVDIQEERIPNVRNDHPDAAALSACEAAGVEIGVILEFLDGFHHARARRSLHDGDIVQNAGDGRRGNSCASRNLFEIHGDL